SGSKGLNILAREPISRWFGSWGHPLQAWDEQDCMLFFDNVLVPWDRVFMLYESPQRLFGGGAVSESDGGLQINFAGWANLCRAHYRMRLMTAVATMVAEAIGVIEYREVAAKLGEMVTYCEMWRLAMNGIEHSQGNGARGGGGAGPGMGVWFTRVSG